MAVNTLQNTLADFRRELDGGERAFDEWRQQWAQRESALSRRLGQLSQRAAKTTTSRRPQLAVIAE